MMSRTDADEWEVVDDDGFIYKRRKGKAVIPSPATLVNSLEPVLSEQAQVRVREALARRKKMAMLLAQKEMYAAEVADWENVLQKQEQSQEQSQACASISQYLASPMQGSVHSMDEASSSDDLRLLHVQVEGYERYVAQLQGLLEKEQSVCKMLEIDVETNRVKQENDLFKDLVKVTPRTIIHSLTTSDPALPPPVADLAAKSRLSRFLT